MSGRSHPKRSGAQAGRSGQSRERPFWETVPKEKAIQGLVSCWNSRRRLELVRAREVRAQFQFQFLDGFLVSQI